MTPTHSVYKLKTNVDLAIDGKYPDSICVGTKGRITFETVTGKTVDMEFRYCGWTPIYFKKVLSKGRTARNCFVGYNTFTR